MAVEIRRIIASHIFSSLTSKLGRRKNKISSAIWYLISSVHQLQYEKNAQFYDGKKKKYRTTTAKRNTFKRVKLKEYLDV